jgi:hypothetical protein
MDMSATMQSRGKKSNNTSGRKGVCSTASGKWAAKFGYKCRKMHLGTFDSIEAAGKAYDDAVAKYIGNSLQSQFKGVTKC